MVWTIVNYHMVFPSEDVKVEIYIFLSILRISQHVGLNRGSKVMNDKGNSSWENNLNNRMV